MIPSPVVISPEAEIAEAAKLMLLHDISCLPVLDDKILVGILTRSDILATLVR
jgi:CBS domain-containing protein